MWRPKCQCVSISPLWAFSGWWQLINHLITLLWENHGPSIFKWNKTNFTSRDSLEHFMTFVEIIGDIPQCHETKVGNQCSEVWRSKLNFFLWLSSDSFMCGESTFRGFHHVFSLPSCRPFSPLFASVDSYAARQCASNLISFLPLKQYPSFQERAGF